MTELSFRTFVWAVIVGMGFRLGWGLIVFLAHMLARAVGTDASF